MITLDVDQLIEMSQEQLDTLFRNSPAGDIPAGEGAGTAIIDPGTELSELAAKLIHLLIWHGKVFYPDEGILCNEILPVNIKAIIARVYKGASWFDGKESIILDYSHTSLIQQRIRDEIRLIAPNTYLGIVYWDHDRFMYFALKFPGKAC